MDLGAGQAFVLAVIDLAEQGRHLGVIETRELGGLQSALEGTRENGVEMDHAELRAEGFGVFFAPRGQRKIGASGMTAVAAPLRFAVAGQVELETLRQAGLPIISGLPERSERPALSITAPARTRCPGRTQTRPTAAWPPSGFNDSFTATSTRFAA